MKKLMAFLVLLPGLSTGALAQVTDLAMLAQLQTLVGLATSEQTVTWQNANNIYMSMYYASQQALDTYRMVQNQMESLRYQVESMRERASDNSDLLTKLDGMLAGMDSIRTSLNTVSYKVNGSQIVGSGILPSSKKIQDIRNSIQTIENLKKYPGEATSAYARRVDAAMQNLRNIWRDSEKAEAQAAEDVVALAVRADAIRVENSAVLRKLANDSKQSNKSIPAQLQIQGDYMARLIAIVGDIHSLLSAQALQSAAAQEQIKQREIVAEAISTQSVTLSTPDVADLERQIQSSGISVNDLTGVTTPNGAFDFNKQW